MALDRNRGPGDPHPYPGGWAEVFRQTIESRVVVDPKTLGGWPWIKTAWLRRLEQVKKGWITGRKTTTETFLKASGEERILLYIWLKVCSHSPGIRDCCSSGAMVYCNNFSVGPCSPESSVHCSLSLLD